MVTPGRKKRRSSVTETDPQILDGLLRIHAQPDQRPVDITGGARNLWTKPLLECWRPFFIDRDPATQPDLVAEWTQLPSLFAAVETTAYTLLADPPHAADWGSTSTIGYRERYGVGEVHGANGVVEQFKPLLEVARAVLHPTHGTLIVKLADQVHGGELRAQVHWLWYEALRQGWTLCDEKVRKRAQPVHNTTLTQRHIRRGETYWLVFHPTSLCPGEVVRASFEFGWGK
jgi:hypothetical protein